MDGRDDDTCGFPLSTILFPSFQSGLHQEAKSFLATGVITRSTKLTFILREWLD